MCMSCLGNHAVASACSVGSGGDFHAVLGLIQSYPEKMIQHLTLHIRPECLVYATGYGKSNVCFLFQK